jgi:transposase
MVLTEAQWEVVAPLLPKPRIRQDRRGWPWRDPRDVLNGILWILRTGAVRPEEPEEETGWPSAAKVSTPTENRAPIRLASELRAPGWDYDYTSNALRCRATTSAASGAPAPDSPRVRVPRLSLRSGCVCTSGSCRLR